MPFDNDPYLHHSSTLVSKPMSDPSIFTQSGPTFNTPPLGVNKGGTSPLALLSMQRLSTSHHQPPLLAIKEEPRLEHHRPRLSLSVSHVPGKTRKRHKVATSCNRCRQNKRKCDGGVPCSNCKRNKADCLYTDAQQSRSTWGDLPLSQEKIIGVSASVEDDDAITPSEKSSKPVSTSQPGVTGAAGVLPQAASSSLTATAGISSPSTSRVPKSTAQPSALSSTAPTSASKSPSNKPLQKGYAKQSARMSDGFTSPFPVSTATSNPRAHFIPGHASYEQDFNLDRRKQQLDMQSAQISRAIRVAQPGPQADTTILLNGDSSVQRQDHGIARGLSQDSSLVAQGSSNSNNNISNSARPRVTSSQSVPNTLWRQDLGTVTGSMATFSKQQPQQHHQQQHLLHQQQYLPSPSDPLEARQSSILPSAQPIPQYSDSPKREPISGFSIMGQSNSRMSSGSSSTHSMMSARVASQPQQLVQQQQPPPQQRQQSILSSDASSGYIAGSAFSQGLQHNGLHPPVMVLNEQLPLYDSPQTFGTPQAHFQVVQQQQDQQQFEQELMFQLPGSTSGTPTNIQQHEAQPYQFQAQPPHLQQQINYMHQSHQQDAQQHPQQQHQQQQQESSLGPNHAISSAAPVSSVAIPSGGVAQAPVEAWTNSSTSTPTSGFPAHNNQIDWKSTSILQQPTSLGLSNRPFNPQTDPHYSFTRSPVGAATPSTATPSTAIPSLAGSPANLSGDYGYQQQQQQQQQQKLRHNGGPLRQQVLTSSSPIQSRADELRDEAARIQKIARDILDCQEYDYSVFLPRHISQEYPDLWVAPHSNQPGSLDGIPRQLLVLPKDANFLVDVFFENACFYYPILNRMAVEMHLMEPHTAHSLFLLNIVFMAACKHLGKSTYIKRAIQFRERARELQYHIDGRVRLSRIQGALLGSQVIYGVFTVVIGFAQLCGSYIDLPTWSNLRKAGDNGSRIGIDDYGYNDGDNETMMTDIAEESRKLVAQKGVIPEAAYQQRLWSFWTIFARDSIARLYFGWPHGIDSVAITAELPKIKGSVGLGGRRKGLNGYGGRPGSGGSGSIIGSAGKRRGAAMRPVLPPGRKVMKAADNAAQKQHKSERDSYRVATTFSDDDDDDDDEDDDAQGFGGDDDDESDLEQGDICFQGTPGMTRSSGVDTMMSPAAAATGNGEKKGKWSFDGPLLPSVDGHEVAPSISGLSKTYLEKQSRGEDIHRRGSSAAGHGGSGSGSGSGGAGTGTHSSIDIKRHTERMKLLLDAEDDVTDGGTYSRILFLEEIKLWMIGRRAGLYLMGRSTSSSASPLGAMTGSYSTTSSVHDLYGASTGAGLEARDPFATAINATAEASRYSEQAWLEDKELQGLQAELMAWERALPPMFKFRQDVDAPDINHKVNGKLAVLSLFYYTITIMLQSSYLPIPQYLSSSSRSTAFKSPESISQEYDELFSRSQSVASTGLSDDGVTTATQVKRESGDEYLSPNRFAYLRQQQQHQRNNSNGSLYGSFGFSGGIAGGYFNTAHKICTQLSNVLYHHLELMLDSYPNWCSIQSKLNHSLVAALRVSCLNARLSSNSQAIRDEAKAGFKMGSDLFKRQALLPDPLTIRDWPAEEDVQVMLDLEEEFREMMTTQEEEERSSRSHTRDQSEETAAAAAAAAAAEGGIRMVFDEDPGDRLLYIPQNPDDAASLTAIAAAAAASAAEGNGMGASDPNSAVPVPGVGVDVGQQQQILDANNPLQYGLFRAEHVFGLGEGFQFDYSIDP